MRLVLGIALIVGATALACHGFYNEKAAEEAWRPLAVAPAGTPPAGTERLLEITEAWPYSSAAVRARGELATVLRVRPLSGESPPLASFVWERIRNGFSSTLPYVLPEGAAGIALAALLLVCFMPRQRARGLAVLLLVLGAAACWPSLAPPALQAKALEFSDHVRTLMAWLPRISVGLIFLAGILFLAGSRVHES